MNRTMKRVSVLALVALMVVMCVLPMMAQDTYAAKSKAAQLKMKSWNPEVKKSMNDFMKLYGKTAKGYNESNHPYVVFDFDNTCSIFDVEEQLAIYQLQTMAFAKSLKPSKLPGVLKTGLAKEYFKKALGEDADFGSPEATYQDWIDDITAAYKVLYKKFGPFSPKGLSAAKAKKVQKTDDWKEFASKMRAMYDVVYNIESPAVAYPWVLYWFTGMTETEVYDLAKRSHAKYKKVKSADGMWATPASYNAKSKVGEVQAEFTLGTAVSKNIVELMKTLDKNGIDVWICSASATDPIRAAVDEWGLHKYVTGVIAMTNKLKGGKYVNAYDYAKGRAWKPVDKSKKKFTAKNWKKFTKYATKSQTQGRGKVYSINNVPKKIYKGEGPIAGFMDSTGDYNFCTEYKNLKAVICFNRANRKITDGGGVIAALAVYQADTLKYKNNLKKANMKGDTLYLLQGRQENGLRGLLAMRETQRLGKKASEKLLFRPDGGNAELLKYIKAKKLTTKQVINKFVTKTGADDSVIKGFKYGFIEKGAKMRVGNAQKTQWKGYHTEK